MLCYNGVLCWYSGAATLKNDQPNKHRGDTSSTVFLLSGTQYVVVPKLTISSVEDYQHTLTRT
jgi:hypothetical protein